MERKKKDKRMRAFVAAALAVALLLSLPVMPFSAAGKAYAAGMDYQSSVTGTTDYAKAFQVLELVNSERSKAGLEPLNMSVDLLGVARQRVAEVSVYFSHTRPSGLDCFSAAAPISGLGFQGENIAMGYGSAASVMNGWMNSPGHRSNIMSPNYREIGIGCFINQNGGTSWVQYFADRSASAVASQPQNVIETIIFAANTDYVLSVQFDSCGGSPVQAIHIAHQPAGSAAAYGELPAPTRTGYSFDGWYTASSGGAKVAADTPLTGNATLYAHWIAKKFKVTYVLNKGKLKGKKYKTVTYGERYGKLAKPTRAGYKFKGWYTKAKGGKKITANSKVTIQKNTKIYARWRT
ncbi:MAG: InlB B-repeat-containing protein [Clostridiales Family XIII bacterium]|jgi:uncharacterized repeat protein (TIGR02543 family)|nr:InlB B-repeat-containing protein [Clostridiales Family XIII bacterium]